VPKVIARLMLVAAVLAGAAACGYDTSAAFNSDGSVTVGLKFLFPKSLMSGANGASVSGFKPSDIASANAKLQTRYPGGKVTVVTEGDESGALISIPFKTEKDAFAFMTQPSNLSPASSASSSGLNLNLSNTGGMFTSATHTTSGQADTYTFKTAPATQPSPSPGSQEVLTQDELSSMFTVTFALTVPHVITSAPGALFSLDRKTAIWKLTWLHAQTLTATTSGDTGLVASVSPVQGDARLAISVGFIAIAVGFLLGMFLTWRGLLPRRPQAALAPAVATPPVVPEPTPAESASPWQGPPLDAPPPSTPAS
jgi:hypothetical protein